MKIFKRIFSVLLSLVIVMVITSFPLSAVSADVISDGNYCWNYSSVGGKTDYYETMAMSDFIISQDRFGKYDNEYLNYNDRQNLGFYLYGNSNTSKYRPGNNTQAVVVDNMVKDGKEVAPKAFKINGGFETNYQPTGTVAASLSGVVLAKDKSGYYTYHPYISSGGTVYAAFLYSPVNEELSSDRLETISTTNAVSGRFFISDIPIVSAEYNGKSISVTEVSGGQSLANSGKFAKLANAFAESGIIPADKTVPEAFATADYADVTIDYNAGVSGGAITLNYAINYKFASGNIISFRMAPLVITASGYKTGSATAETVYSSEDYNNSKYEHTDFKQKFGYAYCMLDRSNSQGFATVNSASVSTATETREYKYDSATTGYKDYSDTKSNAVVFNAAGYGGFDTKMLNYDRTARLAFYTYVQESNYRITNKIQGVALDDIGGEAPTSFKMNGGYYATNRERIGGAYFPGIIAASDDSGYYGYNCSLDKSGRLSANFIYIASSNPTDRVATTGITTSNRFFVITVMKIASSSYNGKKIDEGTAPINTELYKSNSYLAMYVNGLAYAGLIPATSVISTENSSYESQRYTADYNMKNEDGKIIIDFSVSYKYDNGDVLTVNYYPLVMTSDSYSFNNGTDIKYAESPNSVYKQEGLSHENFSARFGYMCYVTSGMDLDAYSTVNYAKLSFTDTEIADNTDCKHTSIKTVPATAATCTEDGIGEREVCSYCGKLIKDNAVIKALGHYLKTDKKEPTCTVAGAETTYCTRCDYRSVVSIPAKGHTVENMGILKEPTCTAVGRKSGTCTVCQKNITENIPKLGHSFGEWEITEKPTYTKTGTKTHICVRCSVKETIKIPILNKETVYNWDFTSAENGENDFNDFMSKSTRSSTDAKNTYGVGTSSEYNYSWNKDSLTLGYTSVARNNPAAIAMINSPEGLIPKSFEVTSHYEYGSAPGMVIAETDGAVLGVNLVGHNNSFCVFFYGKGRNGGMGGGNIPNRKLVSNFFNKNTATVNYKVVDITDGVYAIAITTYAADGTQLDSKLVTVSLNNDNADINYGIGSVGETSFGTFIYSTDMFRQENTYKIDAVNAVYYEAAENDCKHTATVKLDGSEPTCTEAGRGPQTVCKGCGERVSGGEVIKAPLGHDYKTLTVESTCEKAGTTTTTCSRCDYKDVKTLPLKEHTRSEWITDTPATATENGSKHIECTVCHKVLETAIIPKVKMLTGDVNGDGKITIDDAVEVMRYGAEITELSNEAIAAADVNGDGKVDVIDAILILQYDSEIISEFPVNKK